MCTVSRATRESPRRRQRPSGICPAEGGDLPRRKSAPADFRFAESIGVPRFELGASPARTERATRLRHTPSEQKRSDSNRGGNQVFPPRPPLLPPPPPRAPGLSRGGSAPPP